MKTTIADNRCYSKLSVVDTHASEISCFLLPISNVQKKK